MCLLVLQLNKTPEELTWSAPLSELPLRISFLQTCTLSRGSEWVLSHRQPCDFAEEELSVSPTAESESAAHSEITAH